MPLHLSIPQHRRDRATTEKARSLRVGELRWVRVYTDDLDDLAGEPVTVRFLDDAILRLASRRGWTIPYDHRRIANRLDLRTTDVAKAIKRLLTLCRLELVEVAEELSTGGNVQIGLQLHPPAEASHNGVTAESLQSQHRVSTESQQTQHQVTADISAQIQGSLRSVDPSVRHLQRQEQEQEKERPSTKANASSYAAAADADQRPIVNRLIGLVARGNPNSIAVVRYECLGLPDAAVARTIESVQHRQPRPSNPAGYAVETLRAIRRENGTADTRPRIDREPALGATRL